MRLAVRAISAGLLTALIVPISPTEPARAGTCDGGTGGGEGSIGPDGDVSLIGGGERVTCTPPVPGNVEFVPYVDWETGDIFIGYRGGCAEGEFWGVRWYYRYTSWTTKVFLYDSYGCVPDPRGEPFVPGLVDEVDVRAALEGRLPRPMVARDPRADGLVHLETYLWYEGGGLSTITRPDGRTCDGFEMHATEGAIQLDAWVCVTGYEWDMGNGDTVTADRPGSAEDPAAEYVYEQTGDYDLVATTVWEGSWRVSWGGGSDAGTFGAPVRMSSAPETFRVLQVRSAPVNHG